MKPATPDAYRLLHEGSLAFAQLEKNGIRIDLEHLKTALPKTYAEMEKQKKEIKADETFKDWKRCFGDKMKICGSQLAILLFDVLKYPLNEEDRTETGQPPATEAALSTVDLPIVSKFLKMEKLTKQKQFLENVAKNQIDGFLHPFFNLSGGGGDEKSGTQTYRSSSSDPNFQQMPTRNKKMSEVVRSLFIPRKGRHFLEGDYGGIEVKIAACYHKDPVMIQYVTDKTKDMHRDMAARCFLLKRKYVSSMARYCAKNMFVFPQFYGSYYVPCAKSLWEAITKFSLKVGDDGASLTDHLRSMGITSLGKCDRDAEPKKETFEHHVKEVQQWFWEEKFMEYGRWKKRWYNDYLRNGGFHTLTGFKIEGYYPRNAVINYPVQGSAFHCTLESLIILLKRLRKYKMQSLLIGQIHDSIEGDVVPKELENFVEIMNEVMCREVPKKWPWIIVPLEIEVDVAPESSSWFRKAKLPSLTRPAADSKYVWQSEEKKWLWN